MKRTDHSRRTVGHSAGNDKVIALYEYDRDRRATKAEPSRQSTRRTAQAGLSRKNARRGGRRMPMVVPVLLAVLIVLGGMVVHGNVISASAVPQEKIYTSVQIEAGDSLWSIAAEYCEDAADIPDYIEDLKEMNGIVNEKGLQAGGYLTVYYYQE